jgi:maleylpyruvate isomerase
MTPPHSPAPDLDPLHQSEQRVLRTVDSLTTEQFAEPSVLPGWTRAHVVAHLALNAEGMARALDGVAHGRDVPVYESTEARDADIEELAQADPAEIRERVFAAGQQLRDAFAALDPDQWGGAVSRVPDGPLWQVATIPEMRRREVEIHHADLDAGYGPADWPNDFRVELLDLVTVDRTDDPDSPVFTVRATDAVRSWSVGAESPVVEGTTGDLGWWLVGRGNGEGLDCPTGELPTLGPWRRTPAK